MTHLTGGQLDAFLDDELAPDARAAVAVHLAECLECRTELNALRSTFAALATLRPEPIPMDLAARVLAQTRPHNYMPRVGVLMAAQAALAALLAVWLTPPLGEWAAALGLLIPGTRPALELPSGLTIEWSEMSAAFSGTANLLTGTASILAIAPAYWMVAIAAAAVVWLAGNRWLLTSGGDEPPVGGNS